MRLVAAPFAFIYSCFNNESRLAGIIQRVFKTFSSVESTYDGGMEPPPYWTILGIQFRSPLETRAMRRQRCARNYVRKLLRGRKWLAAELQKEQERINMRNGNLFTLTISRALGLSTRVHPHLPYERKEDFFYPERFYWGALLALWFQLLISLAFVAGTRALNGYLLSMAHRLEWFNSLAVAHMQPQSIVLGANRVPGTNPLAAIGLSAAANLYELGGYGQTVSDLTRLLDSTLINRAIPVLIISGVLAFLIHAFMWSRMFGRYRERLLMMRYGRFFFDKRRFDETAASSFIGYQAAFMVISTGVALGFFMTFIALGVIIVLTILGSGPGPGGAPQIRAPGALHPPPARPPPPPFDADVAADAYTIRRHLYQRLGAIGNMPTFIWWFVVAFLFQFAFNRLVWFAERGTNRNGDIGNRWLRLFRYALRVCPHSTELAIGLFVVLYA